MCQTETVYVVIAKVFHLRREVMSPDVNEDRQENMCLRKM